jgi:hypothetical protein
MFVMLASLFALIAFSVFVVGPWAVGPVTVRDFHKPFSVAVGARLAAFLGGPWVRRLWNERSVAGFYILAMAAMYLLALGPEPRVLGRPLLYEPPYAWLMRLPGLDVLRVPARFVMLAAICQSVLVAVALTRWSTPERRRWLAPLVGVALVIEGWVWMPLADVPRRGARPWTGASAVVELPLGDQSADFGALFRAMNHGLPVVNGVSGYVPPHYLPLAHALRDRQFGALFEVATNGRLGVVVDRARPDAMEIAQALRETGFEPASSDEHWDTYVVPPRPPASQATGEKVPIAHVNASSHGEDVARMLDDDVETAWGSATSQVGGETITVDLGVRRDVGAVVLDMGAFSFGHPTVLEVAVSDDALSWQVVWAGSTSVLTVRAAVQRPDVVPMTVYVGRASGRYLRLTQTGAEPGIPWWVANLHVHASVTR